MTDPVQVEPHSHEAPAAPSLTSRLRLKYDGRHTALAAGALEEPGALPLPAWGTFLGIALGVIAAVSGTVYGVLFASDRRWVPFVLAVLWGLMGGAVTAAAARLRRDEPMNPVIIAVGVFDAVLGGLYLAVGRHAHGPGLGLALLGVLTAVGTAFELAAHPRVPEG
jgi:hypothetical protein